MKQQTLLDATGHGGEVRITDPWPADLPWPHAPAAVHGFDPVAVTRAKGLLREAARMVVGDRPDRDFLVPALVTVLTVEVHDFVRFHQSDQSGGFASPDAKRQAMATATQAMAAWPAQVTDDQDRSR